VPLGMIANAVVGIVVGSVLVAVFYLVRRLRGKHAQPA
jgi:predicted DNA repair protein MutK